MLSYKTLTALVSYSCLAFLSPAYAAEPASLTKSNRLQTQSGIEIQRDSQLLTDLQTRSIRAAVEVSQISKNFQYLSMTETQDEHSDLRLKFKGKLQPTLRDDLRSYFVLIISKTTSMSLTETAEDGFGKALYLPEYQLVELNPVKLTDVQGRTGTIAVKLNQELQLAFQRDGLSAINVLGVVDVPLETFRKTQKLLNHQDLFQRYQKKFPNSSIETLPLAIKTLK